MLRVFKWLWHKAQNYGEERLLAKIDSRAQYHRLMAENAFLKRKLDIDARSPMEQLVGIRYTAGQHRAISSALTSIITDHLRQLDEEAKQDGR